FTLLGVPSGQYVLRVLTPRVTGGPVPPSTTDKPILWAAEPITVGDTDLTDLSVTLRHTFRVTGRVEFRGSKPGPSGDALRECCPVSIDPSGSGISALTSPDANGNFTTGVAGDSYFVTAEGPSEWHLKAVMFDGRDISDEPVTIREDISGIVVVYSDAVSQLSGSVRNAQGAPEAGASVVVFPTDRRRWVGYGSRFPRRVVSTPASPTGAFTVTALPPGDYFVAAISDSLLDTWRDPKVLEALSRTAVRMSLAENEKKSVNLTTERSR
ncbi:MAG: carboxypeptidase-like regulatory domain-containing protein, partial [Acidobacteriota bacterium]